MKLDCDKCKKDLDYKEMEYFADDYKFCFSCACEFRLLLYHKVREVCVEYISSKSDILI